MKKLIVSSLMTFCLTTNLGAQNIRFTVGKNGALYAFCMEMPDGGQEVSIKSLGKKTGAKKVRRVSLLGSNAKLKRKQTAEALVVTCPKEINGIASAVFRIEQ